ncbi:MAG: UDP-glucose 4-epimerase GalE [Fidelibacterota bacterium]
MNILVTGGAGYIGSHVVLDLCEAGHAVVVLDDLSTGHKAAVDSRAQFFIGSTLKTKDLEAVFKQPFDAVIHLAAFKAAGESMENPEAYSRNNICGTVNLLNVMLKHTVKTFVFSSTAAVYGNPQYLPIDEKHPLEPINYYGFTKLEIERILAWYGKLKGLKFASLRYFNAAGYDPRGRITSLEDNPANLLPIVMETAAGKRKQMQVFGNDYPTSDGTGRRDYIHVSDLSRAHLQALEYLSYGDHTSLTVNLATGEHHSVLEVIQTAEMATGKPIPYEITPRRPGDPPELYANSNQADELLNWKPQFSDLTTILETMWQVYKP